MNDVIDDIIPDEAFDFRKSVELFGPFIKQMVRDSRYTQSIKEIHNNVFQESNKKNQVVIQAIAKILVKPKSYIVNAHNLEKLAQFSKEGKSCLLLPEHYSNFDYPAFFYLSQKETPTIKSAFQNLICMAASKLNTENKAVLAVSEAYNRILIYPARAKKDTPTEEEKTLGRLNQKAIKEMVIRKKQGHIILIFPSGTRYRPGKPETRQALQQIMSFIKSFDYFCFVGIAGNALMINSSDKMSLDVLRKDNFVYFIDEVKKSKEFLSEIKEKKNYSDKVMYKEAVSKAVTEQLMALHKKAQEIRHKLIEHDPPEYLGPFIPPEFTL